MLWKRELVLLQWLHHRGSRQAQHRDAVGCRCKKKVHAVLGNEAECFGHLLRGR